MNWAIELARAYRPKDGEANVFGVVIYTDAHPHLKKVLSDEAYWTALDELSGPRWVVFATRAVAGTWHMPSPGPGRLGLMRRVWKEPRENRDLLEAFGIESTSALPMLVVFAEDKDGEVHSTRVELHETSEQEAFSHLREILIRIASALEVVPQENRRTETMAFNATNYALSQYRDWKRLQRGVALWQWIRSFC
jgi:hypothetical protein